MPAMTPDEMTVRAMMPKTMAVIDRLTANDMMMAKIPASSSTGEKVRMCPMVFQSDGKLAGAFVVVGGCADAVGDASSAMTGQGRLVMQAAKLPQKPKDDFRLQVEGAMGSEPDDFNVFVEMPVDVTHGGLLRSLGSMRTVQVTTIRFHAYGMRDEDAAKVVEEALKLRVMGKSPKEIVNGLNDASVRFGAEPKGNSMMFPRDEPDADVTPRMG